VARLPGSQGGKRLAVVSLPEALEDGLVYSSDLEPGIRRSRRGRGFLYRGADGERITDAADIERLKRLTVPPAWTDVWICAEPRGHLQATGRDSKGRKVYRYHAEYRAQRDRDKFDRLADFGAVLGRIRRRVAADIADGTLSREKVLAAVVQLLERTMIRVGNEEYAQANRSYGLTTLRSRHARCSTNGVNFVFRGKSGRDHRVTLNDRRLARVVRRCQDLPGQQLFQYLDDDGERRSVTSTEVNAYLREASGIDVTAKDFRTWSGTLLAAQALIEVGQARSERLQQRHLKGIVRDVADQLGNTPTVCRTSYIHPCVVDAYIDGSLARKWAAGPTRPSRGLLATERKLLAILRPGARGTRPRAA